MNITTPESKLKISEALKNDDCCTEFYTRHFSKIFSCRLSQLFIAKNITANHVTWLMIAVGIIGSILIATPFAMLKLLGGLLLILINILDTCDGEIARATETSSLSGVFIDKLGHVVTNQILFLAVGYHFFSQTNSLLLLVSGVLTAFFLTTDDIVKEIFLNLKKVDSEERKANKLSLSFDNESFAQRIVHVTASSVAFYHIFPLTLAVDMLFLQVNNVMHFTLSLSYFYFFSVVAALRITVRIRRVLAKL